MYLPHVANLMENLIQNQLLEYLSEELQMYVLNIYYLIYAIISTFYTILSKHVV